MRRPLLCLATIAFIALAVPSLAQEKPGYGWLPLPAEKVKEGVFDEAVAAIRECKRRGWWRRSFRARGPRICL